MGFALCETVAALPLVDCVAAGRRAPRSRQSSAGHDPRRAVHGDGYAAPGHRFADAELKWRDLRMKLGRPPAGSSPAAQQKLGLNRDATLSPRKGEGEKLRGE